MDSPVDEIKRRLDLVDVVGQSVALKRAGRTFKGLCPFHAEKTPSFVVFPETGTWRCFGCNEGGDLFTFVMKRDGLEFREALRLLAERANVPLATSPTGSADRERRARLIQTLESAGLLYQTTLQGGQGRQAHAYLEQRGVSPESVARFGLGLAPRAPGALLDHLRRAGFNIDEAESAGLVGRGEDGVPYERLRDRLIFPIRDSDGQTIAFGGRTLDPAGPSTSSGPKYLNGPQTELFDKSACLYGIDLARSTIRMHRQLTVVEGYLDVVIAHQAEFTDVVATLGTAITERHLRTIRRQVDTLILALDADAAGEAATLRVAQTALGDEQVAIPHWHGALRVLGSSTIQLKVMPLPSGQDPDDVIRASAERWRALAASALPVVDFVLSRLSNRHDLSSARGKADAAREALSVIRDLGDPVERAHYVQQLADLLGVDASALAATLPSTAPRSSQRPGSLGAASRGSSLEEYLLAHVAVSGDPSLLAGDPVLRPDVRELLTIVSDRLEAGLDLAIVFDGLEETELADLASRVSQDARQISELDTGALVRDRKLTLLEFRRQRLYRQLAELDAAVSSETGEAGEGTSLEWLPALERVARQIGEVESALASDKRVGSMAWRSRQGRELLGA